MSEAVKMSFSPLISVIIVVYNSAENIEQTLQSVIRQTYRNIELVIIDGGSTDGTRDILEKYQQHFSFWTSEKDKGIYDAMNKGLSRANGDYVTFLNSGDYYCGESVLESMFMKFENADVIYGDIHVIEFKTLNVRYQKALNFTLHDLLNRGTGVVCHQAIFVRRSIAPIYDTSLKFKAELNWYFDIIEKNPGLTYLHQDMPVIYYRIGGFGHKHFWENQFEWFLLVIKRFGWNAFFKYKYPKKIRERFKYRYAHILKRYS